MFVIKFESEIHDHRTILGEHGPTMPLSNLACSRHRYGTDVSVFQHPRSIPKQDLLYGEVITHRKLPQIIH